MKTEREPLFYENAIPIGKAEITQIKDMAHNEWLNSIMPRDFEHKDYLAYLYLCAIQNFLISKGCKLQFKIEVK